MQVKLDNYVRTKKIEDVEVGNFFLDEKSRICIRIGKDNVDVYERCSVKIFVYENKEIEMIKYGSIVTRLEPAFVENNCVYCKYMD